jgi:hypothetical protein
MGSFTELLVIQCLDCKHVNLNMNILSQPKAYYCTITNCLQPNEVMGKLIHCAGFEPREREWDK